MSRITKVLKDNYLLFYSLNQFNEELAKNTLRNYSDSDKRVKCLKSIYELVLNSSVTTETCKIYIRNVGSAKLVADIYERNHCVDANYKRKSENCINVEINNSNKRISEYLIVRDFNIVEALLNKKDISEKEWNIIDNKINAILSRYNAREFKKQQLLLNLSVKRFCNAIDQESFDKFIEIIKPYFMNQRKLVQKKLSSMQNEVGYFNYLFTSLELSDIDKVRKNQILELMDAETYNEYHEDLGEKTPEEVLNTETEKYNNMKKRIEELETEVSTLKSNNSMLNKSISKLRYENDLLKNNK